MKIIKAMFAAFIVTAFSNVGSLRAEPVEQDTHLISVAIVGAVVKPGLAELSDKSTLISVLAAAGWFAPTAKLNNVAVLRGLPGHKLERQEYDIPAILDGKSPNVKIQSGDIVYVDDNAGF